MKLGPLADKPGRGGGLKPPDPPQGRLTQFFPTGIYGVSLSSLQTRGGQKGTLPK